MQIMLEIGKRTSKKNLKPRGEKSYSGIFFAVRSISSRVVKEQICSPNGFFMGSN